MVTILALRDKCILATPLLLDLLTRADLLIFS